jgi:hypothetical protein
MVQLYANLGVKLNGDLLLQQCGVRITDHVNKRCRVRVDMVMPESGPEVDARARLGEVVDLSVHIVKLGGRTADVGQALVELRGPIVESYVCHDPRSDSNTVTWAFVVEQGRLAPENE